MRSKIIINYLYLFIILGSTSRICVVDDDSQLIDESRPCFRSTGDLVKVGPFEPFCQIKIRTHLFAPLCLK